ncbi:MAG: aldehyde dehydrogenase family protein, partial [Micromonosporaceae bacterium]|nr:aldehyde dehydrogenase family protein [Micromonosporaceae bacterium]
MVYLDALGARGPFRAQNRSTITDVTGTPLAELSLVPPVFVTRTMSALRRASTPATDDRIGMIARAGELFATATLGGQSVDEYQHMVSRVSGIPVTAVRESTGTIATRLSRVYFSIQHARPAGAVGEVTDPMTRTGRAVWVRRGSVFAVQAAGNHPGPHGAWPEALALGYRVAVRPSQREPFTPHRLITALRSAGFPDDTIALLPTGHDHAEAVLRDADRSMVYGGEAVVSRYRDSATVLPQGPGR